MRSDLCTHTWARSINALWVRALNSSQSIHESYIKRCFIVSSTAIKLRSNYFCKINWNISSLPIRGCYFLIVTRKSSNILLHCLQYYLLTVNVFYGKFILFFVAFVYYSCWTVSVTLWYFDFFLIYCIKNGYISDSILIISLTNYYWSFFIAFSFLIINSSSFSKINLRKTL